MTRWLGREIVRLPTVGSTNDELAERARDGAAHGTVLVAEAQTRGRGRQGRRWYSPPGDNLYVSVLLRLDLPPSAAPPVTLAAGVAVCDAARSVGVEANLKWPNDVHVAGRKVAGILTETSTRDGRLDAVILGIGLNVNTTAFPPDLESIGTSLRIARGGEPIAGEVGAGGPDPAPPVGGAARARSRPSIDRERLLETLLAELERWIDRFVADGPGPIAIAWKQRAGVFGKRVRVVNGDGHDAGWVEGIAEDLDAEGALIVRGDDGRAVRVLSGEVVPMEAGR